MPACLGTKGCLYGCGMARPAIEDYRGLLVKIRR